MLLSAHVKRFSLSSKRDFYILFVCLKDYFTPSIVAKNAEKKEEEKNVGGPLTGLTYL